MSATRRQLDALLRMRRDAELRSLVALARVHAARREIGEEIERAASRMDASRESLRGALGGPIDAHTLRLVAHGAIVLEHRRRRAVAALAATEPSLAQAQHDAARDSAPRRVVERLIHRRDEETRRRAARSEQAAMDEIAARHAGGWS